MLARDPPQRKRAAHEGHAREHSTTIIMDNVQFIGVESRCSVELIHANILSPFVETGNEVSTEKC